MILHHPDPTSHPPAIAFENVSAGYGGEPVLRNVTFEVEDGGIVGILGPNGAGKTTMLRALAGLIRPMRGSIRLFARDTRKLSTPERAKLLGVVPQSLETPMTFSVSEIVMMGRTASLSRWRMPSVADRRVVERAMAFTDVVEIKNRPFSDLSGGEKQRVVIAMVLAQEPRIIVMDEPTSHLDINHRIEVMEIVRRLNRDHGTTIVVISHDLALTAEYCRTLILLDHGRIAAHGSPDSVITEENIRNVYRCEVSIQRNVSTGSLVVLPSLRPFRAETCGNGARIHVIAGGGCAADILRRLVLEGYTVTCGVLNEGDTDGEVAKALGLETVWEKPFSPIQHEAAAAAERLVAEADAVVICGVPFGTGNLPNLDIASKALRSGRKVLIMDGIGDRDYTPGRKAAAKASELMAAGAITWRSITDLFRLLPQPPS